MTRYPAAIKRQARVYKRKMQWMADQIIDQHGYPADAQRFICESLNLRGGKMMRKQITAHDVEAAIAEWKRERVGSYRAIPVS